MLGHAGPQGRALPKGAPSVDAMGYMYTGSEADSSWLSEQYWHSEWGYTQTGLTGAMPVPMQTCACQRDAFKLDVSARTVVRHYWRQGIQEVTRMLCVISLHVSVLCRISSE